MDANRTSPGYQLKDELARLCLPAANRDASRKLAWVNSICILFLLIGVLGAQSVFIPIKPVTPVENIVPTIIDPPPPPPATPETQTEPNQLEKPDAAQVVVVTPDAPNINFSVPTIGNLVVPNAIAAAPPAVPMARVSKLITLNNTGSSGDRPIPPYPKIAEDLLQQGRVGLLITADETGAISTVEVKESSGYPILDRNALDYVKRHWKVPSGQSNQLFQVTITYQLKAN